MCAIVDELTFISLKRDDIRTNVRFMNRLDVFDVDVIFADVTRRRHVGVEVPAVVIVVVVFGRSNGRRRR